MPDADDVAAGMLLSGQVGILFDRMLAAIGQSRDTIYLAPLCPGCPPGARIDDAAVGDARGADAVAPLAARSKGRAARR